MDSRRTLPASVRHWSRETPERRAFTSVDHPGPHARGTLRTLTWRRLHTRVRALAARLDAIAEPGSRVALVCPQGTEYITGFLAALTARQVAVPLYPPGLPGHADRLAAILTDARPAVVLTTAELLDEVTDFCARTHTDGPARTVVAADQVPDLTAPAYDPPDPDPASVAYLQYTSGSTRVPAGVEITHANVVANARQALTAYGADTAPVTFVGWLPLYHDMGLVLSVAAPVVRGLLSVVMDPAAFLQQPVRWLRLLDAHPRALTAAPNFAYDYCAMAVTDAEKAGLRLDGVVALINGSEPVRASTADRFQAAFAAQGLRPGTHCPSYGLAEATVFVSAARPGDPLRRFALDRDALAEGKALPAPPDDPRAVRLTGCGAPVGQSARVVDPATRTALTDGEVGEIWVRGPNVGRGYFGHGPLTRHTFGARLAGPEHDDDRGDWLRTGDLGTVLDGQLLVTGRLKDLIIVDGRNYYPQDVEATVQEAHPAIRPDRLAAFAVPGPEGEETVVVAEHTRSTSLDAIDVTGLVREVRAAVSRRHGLRLADVVVTAPGTVPRTSSGKVSRALTRTRYLDGAYRRDTDR